MNLLTFHPPWTPQFQSWKYSNSFSPLFSLMSHPIFIVDTHQSVPVLRFPVFFSLCCSKSWMIISFPAAPTVTLIMRAKSSITRWKEITSATWLRCSKATIKPVSKMIHSFFVVCHYILDDINHLLWERPIFARGFRTVCYSHCQFVSVYAAVSSFSHVWLLYM